jgi:hypothetical protein
MALVQNRLEESFYGRKKLGSAITRAVFILF